MRKQILIFIAFLFPLTVVAQEYKTYYYEVTAIYDTHGKRIPQSGDGQYYTFTSKACYESDKDGNSENLGSAIYKNYANGLYVFHGKGYYDDMSEYTVTDDYGHMNILVQSGIRYVLTKKTPPAGFTASRHMEYKKNLEAMLRSSMPSIPTNPQEPSTSSSTPRKPHVTTEEYDCQSCWGSGKCPICHGDGIALIYGKYVDCPSCVNGHCSACGGSGKKIRIKRN